MNRESAVGFLLVILLLGGVLLLTRRPSTVVANAQNPGTIKLIPMQAERRYQNKEIRDTTLEYNSDGQMTRVKIEITRDYAIT